MVFIREGPSKYYGLHKEISNMIMQCLQLLRFFFFGTYKHKSNSRFTDWWLCCFKDWWLSNCYSFFFFFFSTNKRSSHLPTVSSPPYLDDRCKHMWHGYMLLDLSFISQKKKKSRS